MKTISSFSLVAISLFLGSCTSSADNNGDFTEKEGSVETVYTFIETAEGTPVARMMISGMSCEQMCGSRIKAAVAALPGVNETELAFHTEGEVDTLTIYFDPALVNEKDMVDAINKIQGGNYQVKEVQLSKEAKTSYTREGDSERMKCTSDYNKANAEKLSIPNIFDALKRVSVI